MNHNIVTLGCKETGCANDVEMTEEEADEGERRKCVDCRTIVDEVRDARDLELVEENQGAQWHWLDIRCADNEASEQVANLAKRHDYDLCSVDFDAGTVRLNRKGAEN